MISSSKISEVESNFNNVLNSQYKSTISEFGNGIWEGESHDNLVKNGDNIVQKYGAIVNQLSNFASAVSAALEYDKAYSDKEEAMSSYHRRLSNYDSSLGGSAPSKPDCSGYEKTMREADAKITSLLSSISTINSPQSILISSGTQSGVASSTVGVQNLVDSILEKCLRTKRHKVRDLCEVYEMEYIENYINSQTSGKTGVEATLSAVNAALTLADDAGIYASYNPNGAKHCGGIITTEMFAKDGLDCTEVIAWAMNFGHTGDLIYDGGGLRTIIRKYGKKIDKNSVKVGDVIEWGKEKGHRALVVSNQNGEIKVVHEAGSDKGFCVETLTSTAKKNIVNAYDMLAVYQ